MNDDHKTTRRGNALPETVLVIGLFSLVMFGAVNMAILGYNQVEADGVTYVAARAAAAHPTNAPSAVASALAGVFPNVQPSALTIEGPTNGMVQVVYQGTSPGLTLLGGNTGSFNVFSRDAEASFSTTPNTNTFSFNVGDSNGQVVLKNYMSTTYKIWLAQTLTVTNAANYCQSFKGGTITTKCFNDDEFRSHCEAFANLKFTKPDGNNNPNPEGNSNDARHKEILLPSDWNPNTAGSNNSKIYGWDASPHTYPSPNGNGQPLQNGSGQNMKC